MRARPVGSDRARGSRRINGPQCRPGIGLNQGKVEYAVRTEAEAGETAAPCVAAVLLEYPCENHVHGIGVAVPQISTRRQFAPMIVSVGEVRS